MATRIFHESDAGRNPHGRMMFAEFVGALAVVGGTHGVMFKVVEARVKSVAEKQKAAGTAARPVEVTDADVATKTSVSAAAVVQRDTETQGAAADEGAKKKKKKKGMFGSMFSSKKK